MMPKIWKIAPKVSEDLIEQILNNRGIKKEEDRRIFFESQIEDFEKDIEIPHIPQAVKRIQKAIEKEELIVVFGDYDVDGICGAAVFYLGLTAAGAKVLPYIPHREKEGYGLSKEGLHFAKDSGASIVITVDCGIVAFEQALYAKELGLDLIITDHHQVLENKPEASVIVHSTDMCGAAVAWCLVRQLVKKDISDELLTFVAIATVCDMISLTGVNRYFLKEGLNQLNKTKRVGLLALIFDSGLILGEIGAYHLGFIIGPRLNAIGRLEHAIDALRLLCTKDPDKARKIAKALSEANDQRKKLTLDAVLQAKKMVTVRKDLITRDKKILILSCKDWLPGIIGLVAGRVAEEYGVATIAISEGETLSKGSARSANGLNIIELIRKCSDCLIEVGGHEAAAGFTIESSNIKRFKERLEEEAAKNHLKTYEPVMQIDAEVTLKQLSKKLAQALKKFEPFGVNNPQPILASLNMRVGNIRTVGEGKHLKFTTEGIDAIAFGMGPNASLLQNGQLVDLAYNLEIDRFNGSEKLQLKVKDIKIT